MRRKLMIYVFSTVATMALLLSAFGAANATPSENQHIAKVGNETVRFNGRSVSIGINGSAYDVGWVLSVLNQSNISTMTFSHYSYKRITNGNQNSYVMIESNSLVQVAQVYSFYKNSIDASIAIKNLQNHNLSIMPSFFLKTMSPHIYALMDGVIPKLTKNLSSVSDAIVPAKYWGLNIGHVSVGWRNDLSIFSGAIVKNSPFKSTILSNFGPITLTSNDTYTIDPMVSAAPALANIIALPASSHTATPAYVPDGDGDGDPGDSDGDAGGGTTDTTDYDGDIDPDSDGTGPSGVSISVTPVDDTPGTTMYINVTSYNAGSGGVSFHLQGETSGNSWVSLGESGNHITWSSQLGYKALRDHASNSYGSTNSNTVNIYIYNYPSTHSESKVYNSNGSWVGTAINGVTNDAPGTDFTDYTPNQNDISLYFGTMFNWSSSIAGVTTFSLQIKSVGEQGFTGTQPSSLFQVGEVKQEGQYSSNADMTELFEYLNNIATSLSYGFIPYFGPLDSFSNIYSSSYSHTFNGRVQALKGAPYTVYYAIQNNSGGPSHNLGIHSNLNKILGNSNTPWHIFLSYSTTTQFVTPYNGGLNAQQFFSTSSTLEFQLNVKAA